MARRIYLWLPCLALSAFGALSACGGSESDFFSNGGGAGASRAGASSHAGSTSSSGAGSSSSAGNPGSAGAVAVAGSTNNGGNVGSGGNAAGGSSSAGAPSGGSGGRAGASSSGGAGGRTGSGGSGATAGRAGSTGVGGSSQDPSCDELREQAEQQLEEARACNLAVSALQCTGVVNNTCDCPVPVRRDDSAETKAYLATMKKIEARKCSWFCTKQACQVVNDATCKSSGSGITGVCTAVSDGTGHGF